MSMHLECKQGDIAERVLLAGDPDRAIHVAETYLDNARLVNQKRGALCYTGTYKDEPVSVLCCGMGNPSMMIYATELCRDYGCRILVRAGTGAGYQRGMKQHDIVLSQAVSSSSPITAGMFQGSFSPIADFGLLSSAVRLAEDCGLRYHVGNTICNNLFYRDETYQSKKWAAYQILCSEMEGEALYTAAARYHAKALMMVCLVSHMTWNAGGQEKPAPYPEQGSQNMDDMLKLALETMVWTTY